MPLPVIEVGDVGTIYSPFSGQPADSDEEGPNGADPTLLFIYYGSGSVWGFVNARLAKELPVDEDDVEPEDLQEKLEVESGILIIVNTGWNGINYYGFAPAENSVSYPPLK